MFSRLDIDLNDVNLEKTGAILTELDIFCVELMKSCKFSSDNAVGSMALSAFSSRHFCFASARLCSACRRKSCGVMS